MALELLLQKIKSKAAIHVIALLKAKSNKVCTGKFIVEIQTCVGFIYYFHVGIKSKQ